MYNSATSLLSNLITASNGHFFSVTFIKKDGSVRTMNCRTGVHKGTKGGSNGLDKDKYFTVYDTQKKAFRAINKNAVLAVRVNGIEAVAV